jgi:hypothetical protein
MDKKKDQDRSAKANLANQSFQAGNQLIVRLLVDTRFDTEGEEGGELVPAETQLIGSWEDEQPAESHLCRIMISGTTWTFACQEIELQPLPPQATAWQEQERIASEDLTLAKRYEAQENNELAWRYYGRAIAEMQASGRVEAEIAKERLVYAFLLIKADQETSALFQLEQSAQAYETKALDPRLRTFSGHLDYAEAAVQALIALGNIYRYRMNLQEESPRRALHRVIDRLLSMNKLIKKRYETKVILLFEVASFLHALSDDEAATYLAQAEKYYTQQLAYLEGLSLIEPVQQVRERVQSQLGTVRRTQPSKISLIAETPGELESFLAELQEKLPNIRITRKVKQERTSPGTRAGFRATATITWTVTHSSSQNSS